MTTLTDYERFLLAQGLKRRADQLSNEINALFKDANEVGMYIALRHGTKDRYMAWTHHATTYLLSSDNTESVNATPINVQVSSGL